MEKEFIVEDNQLVEVQVVPAQEVRISYNLDRLLEQEKEQQAILDELREKIKEAKKQGIKTQEELASIEETPE
jgi:ribosomal silencing factor RsfS